MAFLRFAHVPVFSFPSARYAGAKSRIPPGPKRFLNLATGRTTHLATIEKRVRGGLAVSPDERLLLYTQRDHEGSDLMLVENFR